MKDEDKTRLQLIEELAALRQQQEMGRVSSQDRRQQALAEIRAAVWQMETPDDIESVVAAIIRGMDAVDVAHHECAINLVEADGDRSVVRYYDVESRAWVTSDPEHGADAALRIWRDGTVAHRRDLAREDTYGEAARTERDLGLNMGSVVDVPFASGTLAVRSREPNAFSDEDIEVLQEMAQALSEGLSRMADLQALERRNQELAESVQLMTAYQSIGQATISSLQRRQVLDSLAQHVVQAGVFRSLMIALVDHQAQRVEVVQNYLSVREGLADVDLPTYRKLEPGGVLTPTPASSRMSGGMVVRGEDIIGTTYSLDDENVTATVARTGEMMIIDGWDDRFDERITYRDDVGHNVSYFLPVKRSGRVVAVLATGSHITDKADMLRRIETIQPLLDQVAIALEHARLYEVAQHEIAERLRAEQALRREYEIREAGAAIRLVGVEMERPEDVLKTLAEISSRLLQLGIAHDSCSLQIVNTDGTDFTSCGTGREDDWMKWGTLSELPTSAFSWPKRTTNAEDYPWVLDVWRSGKSRYQPCTRTDSPMPEGLSLVDVPFSHGTLAIHRRAPNAYHADDIQLLERLARQLSPGFQRFVDITKRIQAEETIKISLALQRVRNEVLQMQVEGDWSAVAGAIHRELGNLIAFDGLGINIVDSEQETFFSYSVTPEGARAGHTVRFLPLSLKQAIAKGEAVYRRNRAQMKQFSDEIGENRNSVIDVPFVDGTIAVSSVREDAFRESDIRTLRQFAQTVSEAHRRFQEISERGRRQAQQEVVHEMREVVWNMKGSENVEQMVMALQGGLQRLRIPFTRYGVNVVEPTADGLTIHFYTMPPGEGVRMQAESVFETPRAMLIADFQRRNQVVCRNDLRSEDQYGELLWCSEWNLVCIVDVPFSHGTLAVSSDKPDAFSPEDIQTLQVMGQVLSEGFQRQEDLLALEQRNRRLEAEIAERKRMEQEVIHLERMRASGELAAGVSHNLNNMLTSVLGPAQILLRKSDDPEIRREAEATLAAGRRARDLVMRLNQAVRSRQGSAREPVAINDLVEEVVQMSRPRWKDEPEARGVTVEVVTRLADTADVRGSSAELHDAVLNLLLNAVDAMPAGGTITIATRAVEAGVQLIVSDTGMGMDEEICRRVFEPFFTTKTNIGSGLGLSTVHGTVTRGGGTIEVDSTPGEGTTFTLRLPAWTGSAVSGKAPATSVRQARPARLLIVEDDEEVSDLLDRLLSDSHTVTVVADGKEALGRFVPGQCDVALIDLGMPGLAGDQVAARMRQLDPSVALVLVTGWVLEQDDVRLRWFDLQIPKPFDDLDEVESVVARAIELHDSRE